MSLLTVEELSVAFETRRGPFLAVDSVCFALEPGETLGIVGESGCGKSLTSLALMGLLPPNAHASARQLRFGDHNLLTLDERARCRLRGSEMAMIFQDPMTSLNPSFTVGFQMLEVLRAHRGGSRRERYRQSVELLTRVGIPEAESRMDDYPHQLSGGMCQRVMIAAAIACRPSLLIADEPTTALDVTIQAQILALLAELQRQEGMSMVLITHDIGVVSENADRIAIMYAGQIVETGRTPDVLTSPRHPYTAGLLRCQPGANQDLPSKGRLPSLKGLVPDLMHRPEGCQFHPRCPVAEEKCRQLAPVSQREGIRRFRCHNPITPPRHA
jgi:dipeptide transport system ATP-binding protein